MTKRLSQSDSSTASAACLWRLRSSTGILPVTPGHHRQDAQGCSLKGARASCPQAGTQAGGTPTLPVWCKVNSIGSDACATSRRSASPAQPGFTLLEVLVASAVLSILVVILLGTLTATLSVWRNSDNKVTADREGRSAQLILGQDLANIVMPAQTNFWPRLVTNSGIVFLQFLTLKPQDYQGTNDVGDVCYVEYAVDTNARCLVRKFQGSADTFASILKVGAFNNSPSITPDHQLVADNLLVDNNAAARRMALYDNVKTNHFVILRVDGGTNLLPIKPDDYAATNRPAMIEFNFAAVDPQTGANAAILANTNILLRSAGLFTSRVRLPDPAP